MSSAPEAMPAPRQGFWLSFLCLTLLGYALLGKGWAYVGIPPLFIGEIVLICGVVGVLYFGQWHRVFDLPAGWALLLLVGWGLLRIQPDISRYGADVLRDSVIWGYSVFAVLVFAAITVDPVRLVALLRSYRKFIGVFLVGVPVAWFLFRFFIGVMPRLPGSNVAFVVPKGGDVMVHSAGLLAFWVVGFAGAVSLVRVLLLAGLVLLVGTFDRSGLLSFLAVFGLCLLFRPRDRSLWRLLGLAACGLIVLAVVDVRIEMPGREREISSRQFIANLVSFTGKSTRTGDLDETKEWRLEWWSDIRAYTLGGRYFWTGKGFGINLADDDGYQVEDDGSLRNPHNGHLNMLARGGVPGFCLWVLVQLCYASSMIGSYVHSRQAGEERWANLFLFLLAYWLAFMINTSFDVFLEGPMGGIWFWSVFGVGLAAMWIYRYDPEVLAMLDVENQETAVVDDGRKASV